MKLITASVLFLVGCPGFAQSSQASFWETALIDQEPIQMEQVSVPAFDVPQDSETSAVAVNTIPEAPRPSPITASILASAVSMPRTKKFQTFRSDRFNRTLLVNEFLARGLDAWSTYRKLNNLCGCYREGSHFFNMSMTPVFETGVGAYSYSLGIATAYSLISARLWNASKDHPRHARVLQRMSRALLITDSSMEYTAVIRNLTIAKP